MSDFTSSLLREKFTITEKANKKSSDKIDNETFVIRTQNMHSCARLAAAMAKEFFERGTIANRAIPIGWHDMWNDVIKGYERDWNENIWCAIYHKGRVIYEDGERHSFLDIIEQCDAANNGEYSQSVEFAENAFSKAGKEVDIHHSSNVALIIATTLEQAKCGIIVRAANSTTTFNYTAAPNLRYKKEIHAHTTLTVAAAFLEGVQLAFQVGLLNKKLEYGLVEKFSDQDRKFKRSSTRLQNLNRAIGTYEQQFNVTYRPERPIFSDMVEKAESIAITILKDEIDAKMNGGLTGEYEGEQS